MKTSANLLLATVTLSAIVVARAQDEGDEPRRCVPLTSIDRTEVIDDKHVVFYLSGRRIYVNELNRACIGLEREGRFSYRSSTGLLCRGDTITVLEDSAFGGLRDGFSCGIGMFEPADEDLLAILKGDEEPAEITVEDIEVGDDETEE